MVLYEVLLYVLGKTHMRSAPSLGRFPMLPLTQFQCSSVDVGPLSSFEGRRSSSASSVHVCLLQAVNSVISLALCRQVMSQTPQHFRGGLPFPPVYLLGHFSSFWLAQGSTPTGVFEGGCRPLTHSSLGFPFHFLLFVARSLNL